MGLPMSRLLLQHGYSVLGFDRRTEVFQEFVEAGGQPSTVPEIACQANPIILMLPNSSVVNQVIGEIERHYSPRSSVNPDRLTVIDMSSSFPVDTRRNAERLRQAGIHLLDAPVSGGVKKAITGELTIMVGGDKETFEQHADLLRVLGKRLYYLGSSGSGHLVKSLNNFLSAVHMLATCEAVCTLLDFGIDPQLAIEVFNHSTGRSGSTEYKFPAFILTEQFNSGFSLGLLAKDVDITRQLLAESGTITPLIQLMADTYRAACNSLGESADHTEIYRYVSAYFQTKKGVSL